MRDDTEFQRWHYWAEGEERHLILPDGCRDVLIVRRKGAPDRIVLTDFDIRPRRVTLAPGTEITGYRLRPGSAVGRRVLAAIAENSVEVEDILGNALDGSHAVDSAILALSLPGSTVPSVARDHGVTVRTMQRRFRDLHLPPPEYWRLLGRARCAAGMLASHLPLAEIACLCSYSDQSHMTRECVRWFGKTPTRLRRDASLLSLLRQPALGNWTGEQISMR
ncbi:helix-turn-helix transcriptional regulator [Afifella pfennigii]|uniref:helix-turn-helix transcriptional regulator n=1 Tax=Afifella pfennigii TaxID=209897 RepID=UPI000479F97B|nr:helix-turn-helix domain-containing protein [Afifella pfennigii]